MELSAGTQRRREAMVKAAATDFRTSAVAIAFAVMAATARDPGHFSYRGVKD
ncbi:MAG: hypothetical protein K0R53_2319 [Burkholderiales bacterium]|jgi:hypothetical protein|nr:hypothetical protein [Burkholderiales bacterium]